MNDQRRFAGAAWPGLALALVGLYAFWTQGRNLDSARPRPAETPDLPAPIPREGIYSVHARLWEDPFERAYEATGVRPAGEIGELQDPATHQVRSSLEPTITGGKNKGLDTILMPVLVPGSDSAEDQEQRLRMRYAVLSALSESGFALSYPTRLSFLRVDGVTVEPAPAQPRNDISFAIPVKLYRPDQFARGEVRGQKVQVLVMWINETQLGTRPLCVVQDLVRRVAGPRVDFKDGSSRYNVSVIGPSSSDVLVDMAREWQGDKNDQHLTLPMRIYSQRATVGDRLTEVRNFEDHDPGTGAPIELIRVIGHDSVLVGALEYELRLRNAWPKPGNPGELVLITESDSSYGRDVINLFHASLRSQNAGDEDHGDQPHFHVVTYFRGTDGYTPRSRAADPHDGDNVPEFDLYATTTAPTRNQVIAQRPEGQSQLDYLVRLPDVLNEISDGRYHENSTRRGICAIGIVGTDVYDKLLILRALRSQFPRTVFFTMDLESHFSHPAEYPTTRNLIVASHFGLQLNHKIQELTPPFRDSYQTSTFLAVRLALGDKQVVRQLQAADPWGVRTKSSRSNASFLQPRVYEIGRRGAFPLSPQTSDAVSTVLRVDPGTTLWDGCMTAVANVWRRGEFWGAVLIGALLGVVLSSVAGVGRVGAATQRFLQPPLRVCGSLLKAGGSLLAPRAASWRIRRRAWMRKLARVSLAALGKPRTKRLCHCLKSAPSETRRVVCAIAQYLDVAGAGWTVTGVAIIVACLAFVVLLIDSLADTFPDVEPLTLFDAISAWPSIFMWVAAIVVAAAYLRRPVMLAIRSLRPSGVVSGTRTSELEQIVKGSQIRTLGRDSIKQFLGSDDHEWAWRSLICAALVVLAAWTIHAVVPTDDFAHHTVRGMWPRLISQTAHGLAAALVLVVTVAVIAQFERCRRRVAGIDALLKDPRRPLMPLRTVQCIGTMTRHLNQQIGWVVALVALMIIPYHPRMDYLPLSPFPVAFSSLAIGAMMLWTYLIRRRANDAKTHAIRVLNEEKRSVNEVDRSFLPDNDPWTQAVDLSRRRHSTVGTVDSGPEVSTVVATKVECDYIDDEIEMIRAVDYGAYAPWYNAPGFAWLGGSAGAIALFDAMLRAAQSGF